MQKVVCSRQNHGGMQFDYVCLEKGCLSQGKELSCVYCCQELHRGCLLLRPIKQILSHFQQSLPPNTQNQFQPAQIIVSGLSTCRNEEELRTNLRQLLAVGRAEIFAGEVDHQTSRINSEIRSFYDRKSYQAVRHQIAQLRDSSLNSVIRPLVQFEDNGSYIRHSPFSISAKQTGLVTAWAQPALSSYKESVQFGIKVQRSCPSWIGIGVSLGEVEYSQGSDKHLLVLSNGWTSERGKMARSSLKLGRGKVLRIKWNKDSGVLEAQESEHKVVFRLENSWKQQIFLCVCLYYKGDRVTIFN